MIAATGTDELLARLDGVQKAGKSWRARCPSCGGTDRKVSISEAANGSTLLHCFAGCEASAVVQAVGLTIADLFPQRLGSMTSEERHTARLAARESGWAAALGVLVREATVILVACRMLRRNEALSDNDDTRLEIAEGRIASAREVLYVR